METMPSLKRVGNARQNEYDLLRKLNIRRSNGTPCPHCDAELQDSQPLQILGRSPQKMDVYCTACGYRGYQSLFQLDGSYFVVPGSERAEEI